MLRSLSLLVGLGALVVAFAVPAFAQEDADLQVRLETDKQAYSAGEGVQMTLDLTNAGESEVTLNYRSGQEYDFVVQRDGQEVWRWSEGKFFTQALQNITLAAGETRSYTETWPQVDNQGNQVPAGEYQIVGIITADPALESSPVTITIGEAPAADATATPGQTLPSTGSSMFGGGVLLLAVLAGSGMLGAAFLLRRRA